MRIAAHPARRWAGTISLTPDQQTLYDRLQSLDIAGADVELTVEQHLAHENGWSLTTAHAARLKCLRFLILAVEAAHAVTPSHADDQAWHLHLPSTRGYCQHLRRDILNRELHHDPR
jgi:hypothetical protein